MSVSFTISTSHPDLSYIKPECPRHLHSTTKSIYYLFPTGYKPGLLKSFTTLYLLSGCVFNKQTFNQFRISPPSQPSSRYFEYLFSLEEAESLRTWGNSWKCGGWDYLSQPFIIWASLLLSALTPNLLLSPAFQPLTITRFPTSGSVYTRLKRCSEITLTNLLLN